MQAQVLQAGLVRLTAPWRIYRDSPPQNNNQYHSNAIILTITKKQKNPAHRDGCHESVRRPGKRFAFMVTIEVKMLLFSYFICAEDELTEPLLPI